MNKSKPSKLSERLSLQKLPIDIPATSTGKRDCSGDENKESMGGGCKTGTACNKRMFSDDDDSPPEPSQQTSLEFVIAGETSSKLRDSFGTDFGKSLHPKKRLLQKTPASAKKITDKMVTFRESPHPLVKQRRAAEEFEKQASAKEMMDKMATVHESLHLLAEQRKADEEFEKQVIAIIEHIEGDIEKVKESEENITRAHMQYRKHYHQFMECSTSNIKTLKSLWNSYFNITKKIDAKQTAQQQKLNSEAEDALLDLQDESTE